MNNIVNSDLEILNALAKQEKFDDSDVQKLLRLYPLSKEILAQIPEGNVKIQEFIIQNIRHDMKNKIFYRDINIEEIDDAFKSSEKLIELQTKKEKLKECENIRARITFLTSENQELGSKIKQYEKKRHELEAKANKSANEQKFFVTQLTQCLATEIQQTN